MKPFKKKKNIIDIKLFYLGIAGIILVIGFMLLTMPKGYIISRSLNSFALAASVKSLMTLKIVIASIREALKR